MAVGSSSLNPRANLVEWSGSEAANIELGQGGYEFHKKTDTSAALIGDFFVPYEDPAIIAVTSLSDNLKVATYSADEELPDDFPQDGSLFTILPVGVTMRGYWRGVIATKISGGGNDMRIMVYKAGKEGR